MFRKAGVLELADALDAGVIASLKEAFWQEVKAGFGIGEYDPESWFANPYNPAGDSRSRRLSGMNPVMSNLRAAGALEATQDGLRAQVDNLFGAGRWQPLNTWYSLLTFPGTESTWNVPNTSWHNDLPIVVGDPDPWTFFVFVFLDRVERETGPTVAVTGSHRRGEAIAEEKGVIDPREVGAFADVNSGLVSAPESTRLLRVGELLPELTATDPWFSELASGSPSEDREALLLQRGTSSAGPSGDSIENRVVAITGSAGDVTIFDPRCLHGVSANVSERPRQVLRLDFRRIHSDL